MGASQWDANKINLVKSVKYFYVKFCSVKYIMLLSAFITHILIHIKVPDLA